MTIHRFFIPKALFTSDLIQLPEQTSFQIAKVLRLQPGSSIILLDNEENEYLMKLESVTPKAVSGTIQEKRKNKNEPLTSISLFQALLPREKFELVLQKGTEVGISSFTPIITQYSIPQKQLLPEKRFDRWEKILAEAAEQSERGIIPLLQPPMTFQQAVQSSQKTGPILIAWEKEHDTSLKEVLTSFQNEQHFNLFIGPEGGFSEEEISIAKTFSAHTISLGPRILRSETAGPIFAALVLFQKET